jgi:hypothetical protein
VYLTYGTFEVTPRKEVSELFAVFDQLVYVNHMQPALNCPYKVSVLVKFGTPCKANPRGGGGYIEKLSEVNSELIGTDEFT